MYVRSEKMIRETNKPPAGKHCRYCRATLEGKYTGCLEVAYPSILILLCCRIFRNITLTDHGGRTTERLVAAFGP